MGSDRAASGSVPGRRRGRLRRRRCRFGRRGRRPSGVGVGVGSGVGVAPVVGVGGRARRRASGSARASRSASASRPGKLRGRLPGRRRRAGDDRRRRIGRRHRGPRLTGCAGVVGSAVAASTSPVGPGVTTVRLTPKMLCSGSPVGPCGQSTTATRPMVASASSAMPESRTSRSRGAARRRDGGVSASARPAPRLAGSCGGRAVRLRRPPPCRPRGERPAPTDRQAPEAQLASLRWPRSDTRPDRRSGRPAEPAPRACSSRGRSGAARRTCRSTGR